MLKCKNKFIIILVVFCSVFAVAMFGFITICLEQQNLIVFAVDEVGASDANPIYLKKTNIIAFQNAVNNYEDFAGLDKYNREVVIPKEKVAFSTYSISENIFLNETTADNPLQTFFGIGTDDYPFCGRIINPSSRAIEFKNIENKKENFGFIAVAGSSSYNNVFIKGAINSIANNVGGLIGKVKDGNITIQNCRSMANTITGANNVGGFIGLLESGDVQVLETYADSTMHSYGYSVTGGLEAYDNIGGVVGKVGGASKRVRLLVKHNATNSPTAFVVTSRNMELVKRDEGAVANMGMCVGSFEGATPDSEIGVVQSTFVHGNLQNISQVGVFGKVERDLTVNLIETEIRSLQYNGEISKAITIANCIRNGQGKVRAISVYKGYNHYAQLKDMMRGEFSQDVKANLQAGNYYKPITEDANEVLTYNPKNVNSTSMRVYGNAYAQGSNEFEQIYAYNDGTEYFDLRYRLSDFTYMERYVRIIAKLKAPSILPKNLVLYDVDSPINVDLKNHYDLVENAYSADIVYSYRVLMSENRKTKEVKTNGSKVDVKAGTYTVYVTLSPVKGDGSTIDAEFPVTIENFTLTVYNSDKNVFDGNKDAGLDEEQIKLQNFQFQLTLWLSIGGCFVAACGSVATFLILKKKRKNKNSDNKE